MNRDDSVRIPPKDDESPEENRRQREQYRDLVCHLLQNEWKDLRLDDLQVDPDSKPEIQALIDEFRRENDGYIVVHSTRQ